MRTAPACDQPRRRRGRGRYLLGDGVNVAARLEQLCEPGDVLVSGAAYDHLQGQHSATCSRVAMALPPSERGRRRADRWFGSATRGAGGSFPCFEAASAAFLWAELGTFQEHARPPDLPPPDHRQGSAPRRRPRHRPWWPALVVGSLVRAEGDTGALDGYPAIEWWPTREQAREGYRGASAGAAGCRVAAGGVGSAAPQCSATTERV